MDIGVELPLMGGCLCGSIRFQVTSLPFDADYCHCLQCQKSTGSFSAAWMDFKIDQVRWLKAKPKLFASSESVSRGFCSNCGCSISYQHSEYPDYLTLSIAALDNPNYIEPRYHIHTDSQVKWLSINDELPRYNKNRIS